MLNAFVNVVELDVVSVVAVHSLQTGDVSKERWSGQAPEHNHRVLSASRTQLQFLALAIEG